MSASHAGEWEEGNRRFLAAALEWLRLRLERQVGEAPRGPLVAAPAPELAPRRSWLAGCRSGEAKPAPTAAAAVVPAPRPSDADVARAAAALAEAEKVDPPPALLLLAERLGLSRFERDVLLLCVAMELDTRVPGLCARVQDDATRPYPTFALALATFDDPAWDVLSPNRPLRHWRLVEIAHAASQPLTTSALRIDERIASYVKGLNYLDDRLAPLLQPLPVGSTVADLPASQRRAVDRVVGTLRDAPRGGRLPVVQLLGADTESKLLVAAQAAAALGLHVYRHSPALLPSHAADLETLARLWERECLLLPIALYLDASEAEPSATGETASTTSAHALLRRFIGRTDGVLFLDTRDPAPRLFVPTVSVDVEKPAPSEQEAAWTARLGLEPAQARALAGQFDLSLIAIDDIASADAETTEPDRPARLWRACLERTRPRLDALARRLDPKATWDDLVLPADETELLRAVVQQVRHRRTVYDDWGFRRRMNRGLGISALFAGESGTGKTMAAEVIANDLRVHLYRIDLSAVVSKYVGETEKNLRMLFDAAEDGGAILFFDEADALFGRRSEVRDSHDRYANIEVNYLLQRMEAYRGLAILATNMKSALDPAFTRRLRFVVGFPYPGPTERKLLWRKAFPAEMPIGALDLDRLACLHLTGASIHNVALGAAFLAAEASTPVTMPLVLNAARTEFRKLERPVNEAEFRWLEPAGGTR